MISAVIMAHKRRAPFVEQLLKQLGSIEVIWDERDDRWDTGRRALLAFDPAADWHLVVQDDAIPAPDLLAGVERAVASVPDPRPLGFYVGSMGEHRLLVDHAREIGASWIELRGPKWGVAIALPTEHIRRLVRWCDRQGQIGNYDTRIMERYRRRGVRCWYSVPSLVDHRPVRENPSLIPGRTADRRAHYFATGSALEIDWKSTAVQPRVHFRHRDSGHRRSALVGGSRWKDLRESSIWEEMIPDAAGLGR